jgi:hypothetical protein
MNTQAPYQPAFIPAKCGGGTMGFLIANARLLTDIGFCAGMANVTRQTHAASIIERC